MSGFCCQLTNASIQLLFHKWIGNVYLKSRVVRAGRVGSSPSTKVSGVVDETPGRNRLAVVLVGVRRIVVVSSTGLDVVVVVVVGLAGRRANNPANPLVDATLASVDDVVFEAGWLSSTSALLLVDSLVAVRAVVVLTPGRRPLMMLATAADPALLSFLAGVSVVVVVVRTDGRRAKRPANPPGVDGASVRLSTVVGASSSDSSFVSSTTIGEAVVVVVGRTPGRRPLTRLANALALLLAVAVAGTTASVSTATSVRALAVVVRPAPGLRPPNRLAIPVVPLLLAARVSLDAEL